MNTDSTTIDERYDALPDTIKQALQSPDIAATLRTIGGKHDLHVNQIDKLFDEVGLVMLGMTHPSKFTKKIIEKMGIEQKMAYTITEDVNTAIFQPLHTSLLKMHSSHEKPADVSEKLPPAVQSPVATPPEPTQPQVSPEIPTPPPPIPTETDNIEPHEKKLSAPVVAPREQNIASVEKDTSQQESPTAQPAYHAGDPYREPIP